MRTAMRVLRASIWIAIAALALRSADAQGSHPDVAATSGGTDAAKVIKAAADALGMPRNGGEGGGALPQIDVINRMQFWGSGNGSSGGQTYKIDYHATVSYNPVGMRVDVIHGDGSSATHILQVVSEKYAWDESEVGAGLVPGKGTATPAISAQKERLLQLWILPYGVVKAAYLAGDSTKVSTETGATVLTFPLSGELAGVTEKATLDAKNFVTKVETKADNPALKDLVLEADYSDYADHGEVQTDIRSPRHILQKRNGKAVLDIEIKTWNADNPYVVFPIPQAVKNKS
jgi:hypothetical protein